MQQKNQRIKEEDEWENTETLCFKSCEMQVENLGEALPILPNLSGSRWLGLPLPPDLPIAFSQADAKIHGIRGWGTFMQPGI